MAPQASDVEYVEGEAEPSLSALYDAVNAQQTAISELNNLVERQADTIAGVVLLLRALLDIVTDEEQREMIEKHLAVTVQKVGTGTCRSAIDALFA